jgi:hypothetical protein
MMIPDENSVGRQIRITWVPNCQFGPRLDRESGELTARMR